MLLELPSKLLKLLFQFIWIIKVRKAFKLYLEVERRIELKSSKAIKKEGKRKKN